jgi:conjugative transposon TraK protein
MWGMGLKVRDVENRSLFERPRKIETAFQLVRGFCLVAILGVLALCGWVVWFSGRQVAAAQQRIYLLASGKAMEALAADRRDNLLVEARDQVRVFHEYFFTLDPDERVIRENISRALYLADGSAKRAYENLKEQGYYYGIVSGNISQRVTVDSVAVDLRTYPYYFRCWATERITRATVIVTRDLMTEGWLRTVSRSDDNPHGFLIERWNTVENRDIKTENR